MPINNKDKELKNTLKEKLEDLKEQHNPIQICDLVLPMLTSDTPEKMFKQVQKTLNPDAQTISEEIKEIVKDQKNNKGDIAITNLRNECMYNLIKEQGKPHVLGQQDKIASKLPDDWKKWYQENKFDTKSASKSKGGGLD